MKPYTIVYSVYVGGGHYITQYERISTDDLRAALKEYENVWFVFDGHCYTTED